MQNVTSLSELAARRLLPTYLPTGVLILSSLLLSGCSDRQRGTGASRPVLSGQTLRVFNFVGYMGKNTLTSFEEKTGSKVVLDSYNTNEELIRRLDEGALYDVVFPSSYALERLVQKGRLRLMNRDQVPNLIQVPDRFRNPPVDPSLRHCVPYAWSMTGLGLLSPRNAPGRDPDSLEALFSAHGPKVTMLDDMRATLGVTLRFLGLSANTTQMADLERARDLLLGQRPRVMSYVNDAGPLLAKGQISLSLAWSGDVLEMVKKNPEVRFVVPREGTLLYVDYACVPQSAPNPDLAFAFLNHLLDPQVAADITNTYFFAAPNLGAQRLLQPEGRWLWGTLDAVKDQGRFEMIRDVGPALASYELVWQQVKAGVPAARK